MNSVERHVRRALAAVLLLLAGAPVWTAEKERKPEAAARPLIIKARIKKGPAKEYETRILAHLQDFKSAGKIRYGTYGGWKGARYKATGFFYVKKIAGRWWLIDPEGYRFLHVAVNSVRAGKSPQNRRAFPGKFGTAERWRDETIRFLRGHGFNGTACWSDNALLAGGPQRLIYTPRWNFMSTYGKKRGGVVQRAGHMGYPNGCFFVFDRAFEAFADAHARQLAATKDDPYLLGHFSDNELPFPRDLLDRTLALPPSEPGHAAATVWLAKRGRSGKRGITAEDREAWLGYVADRYFRIVSRAIKKYDPNHLYLGSRFYGSEKGSAAVFRAAGRYLDAVAVNVYGVWTPAQEMLGRWARWSGKPIIVSEWYAKGDDSGMANETGVGWTVATQQERGWFYQNFTLALLESKVCVGWHWFKYMDNDPEDRGTDPSNRNSNKGMVTARYEPYTPLLAAMRELNRVVYPLTAYFDGSTHTAAPAMIQGPCAVVASTDGTSLYIANHDACQVAQVDLAKQTVARSLGVPAAPTGLVLHPDGRRLFVTCAGPQSTVAMHSCRGLVSRGRAG